MVPIIGNLFLYLGLYRMIRTMFGTAYVGYQKGDTIVVSKKQNCILLDWHSSFGTQ